MVVVALYFQSAHLWIIQAPNNQNTLIVQSFMENLEIHFHYHRQAHLIHYFIRTRCYCDSKQNLGQTQILYKPGKTHLTQTEHNPVDPNNAIWFQPLYVPFLYLNFYASVNII